VNRETREDDENPCHGVCPDAFKIALVVFSTSVTPGVPLREFFAFVLAFVKASAKITPAGAAIAESY
jgi:hypothetical protein